jgi:hypothetical protein
MITFKQYLIESLEPMKPIGKVDVVSNEYGIKYKFETSKGNLVHIEISYRNGDKNRLEIDFSVNGSVEEIGRDSERDVEIFSGVLYILLGILKKASSKSIKSIEFTAMSDSGDSKAGVGKVYKDVKTYLIDTFREVYHKLVRNDYRESVSKEEADLYTMYLNVVKYMRTQLSNDKLINDYSLEALISGGMVESGVRSAIEKYNEVLEASTSERGIDSTNRRAKIYYRLIHRYAGDKWNIRVIDRVHFELTRKRNARDTIKQLASESATGYFAQ